MLKLLSSTSFINVKIKIFCLSFVWGAAHNVRLKHPGINHWFYSQDSTILHLCSICIIHTLNKCKYNKCECVTLHDKSFHQSKKNNNTHTHTWWEECIFLPHIMLYIIYIYIDIYNAKKWFCSLCCALLHGLTRAFIL